MTSGSNQLPRGPAAHDLILLALFQSRLRERSQYLGQVIQSQRKRLPALAQAQTEPESGDEREAELERIRLAEQALVAVRDAEDRLDRGSYGLCDACQQAIGGDELLESPETTTCRSCSTFGSFERIWLKA